MKLIYNTGFWFEDAFYRVFNMQDDDNGKFYKAWLEIYNEYEEDNNLYYIFTLSNSGNIDELNNTDYELGDVLPDDIKIRYKKL